MPVSRRLYVVQFLSREHERITTLDAIIQTLTLAIVLLIIGMACLVIGIAGLVWTSGRDSRRRDSGASTSGAFSPSTSARSHREKIASSRLSGHP